MTNKVNKKLKQSKKAYTTTVEILDLKQSLRTYQKKVRDMDKLIKYHNKQLVVVDKKSDLMMLKKTIEELQGFKTIFQDGVKLTSLEIQQSRQLAFEGLLDWSADRELSKERMVRCRNDLIAEFK